MRLRLGLLLALPASFVGGFPAGAQESPAPPLLAPVDAERVEVDLVVRDKDGRLLRDLDLGDVEVLEDGVRQDVDSLTWVEHAPGGAPPSPEPVFVALVFDRLGPASRRFARQAALEYLSGPRPGTEVGVFAIDRGLSVPQGFTDDASALREAVESMTSRTATALAGKRERELTRNAYHGLGEGLGQAHVASAESRGAPECRGREEVRIRLNELLESRLVESFESLERDQQGFASTHALLSLIAGLSALPGRKAVLLFSEGLAIPSNVEATYRSVIGAANRARVSVYTVDAGGLRVESPADELRRTLDTVKTRSRYDTDGGRLTEESLLGLQEKNEGAMRLAPASTLVPLADETGGFALSGTNDLAEGLSRFEEELRSHYVLSYAPRNRDFDGRFRRIEVKVGRPHGRLQARKGYLALRTALPVPVLPHEAAALAMLDAPPGPQDVPLRVRGLQFPESEGASRVPILVEVPAGAFGFDRDDEAQRYRQDFTILVRVRNASGQVVAKASEQYPLSGSLDRLEEARRSRVLFYREMRLPPGVYTLEAVALDARTGHGGTAVASLDVPRADPGRLRASSLMVVGRAEKVAAGRGGEPGPLQYRDVLMYPDLGQRLRREAGRPLAFFLSAWPAPGRPEVDARVEILRAGRPVAAAKPFELHPDPDGRIGMVSTLPLDSLAPGAYELRVTLTDGRDEETRSASLAIAR
jgi:VWFA-related protein